MARFRIEYEIDVTLDESEIWPDGDAPETPTADDVRALIDGCGGIERVLTEWCLNDAPFFKVVEVP